MPRQKKWFKTLREARKVAKERNAAEFTDYYQVYKLRGKYLVGGHWDWLQAVS